MKNVCENCVFFLREHKFDKRRFHYVDYSCNLTNEAVYPQHGACKYYIESTKED